MGQQQLFTDFVLNTAIPITLYFCLLVCLSLSTLKLFHKVFRRVLLLAAVLCFCCQPTTGFLAFKELWPSDLFLP